MEFVGIMLALNNIKTIILVLYPNWKSLPLTLL